MGTFIAYVTYSTHLPQPSSAGMRVIGDFIGHLVTGRAKSAGRPGDWPSCRRQELRGMIHREALHVAPRIEVETATADDP